MLDNIKTLLDITTDKEDSKLNIYISMAVALIKKYLNNDAFDDSYIEENFSVAIVLIVTNAYECKKNGSGGNIKSMTQGSRSVTYGDDKAFCLNNDIKAMLPTPYIKTFY
jgi:hypothetical protein